MDEEDRAYYDLPEDIIYDMLLRLPVKSLLRFSCVCKSWRILIKTEKFIKLHLQRTKEAGNLIILCNNTTLHTYNFHHTNRPAIELHTPSFFNYYESHSNELPPPVLVGSCNGLVCFAMPRDCYVLYNPATRAYKELPKVKRTNCYGFRAYSLLAYDHVGDDYKVFELFEYSEDHRRDNMIGLESLIYSMKANSWKTIDTNVPYYGKNFYIVGNSSLHWLDKESKVLRTFNLFTERYYDNNDDGVVEEDVCMVSNGKGNFFECLMSTMTDCWTVLPYVSMMTDCWTVLPYVCSKYGRQRMIIRKLRGSNLMYMLECSGRTTEVQVPGLSDEVILLSTVKPWVETLVSLE